MDADTKLNALTDGRPEAFFRLLEERAKELATDYPFTQHDAFEWLWAITSTLEGTDMACDDWRKRYLALHAACEWMMGNWTSQKARDAVREVLNRTPVPLGVVETLAKHEFKWEG